MPNKKNLTHKLLQPIKSPPPICIWKWLADFWGYLTIIIFITDFFYPNNNLVASTGAAIIYTAVLVIYVTNKEFNRWQQKSFSSHYFGEIFIAIWSTLLVFFVIATLVSNGTYKVEPEFYTTYITILGIFAISLNSKNLQQKKRKTNKKQKIAC